uniref:Uncharacterized protein n=1 Tax=Xiphophorus maculatus TaxID=8083 RepID=M4AD62_XIPMA
MPGGGIPIGAPRPGPGGIPIGGPIGGRMPGGGPIIPVGADNAGACCCRGNCASALRRHHLEHTEPVKTGTRRWTRPTHITMVTCWEGIGAPAGTPRPAARPTPGPPATPARGTRAIPDALTSLGGGPSTVMETRFSPRSRTRPRTRFSSRSGCFEFFGLQERTGSKSHRMRFMCLSKALKVPMKMRPSCRMHLILKSMCCSILLLFPTVCSQSETSSSMTSSPHHTRF